MSRAEKTKSSFDKGFKDIIFKQFTMNNDAKLVCYTSERRDKVL